jgi:hypothetical protein
MVVVRWLVGLVKHLTGIWQVSEWNYYAKTSLDPKIAAFQRWEVAVKADAKPPDNDRERLLPQTSYKVILHDKYGLTPEDVIFFTVKKDQAEGVEAQYLKELRSRSCGEFYYSMIKNRQLDFFHNFHAVGDEVKEGGDVDEETRREMFLR